MGSSGASFKPFGALSEALGTSGYDILVILGALDRILEPLGTLLGPLGRVLGVSWEPLGRILGRFWKDLGAVLDLVWSLESIFEAIC